MATNILDSNTRLLVVGEGQDKVEAAFGVKLVDGKADLPGVVSRKKQVVPPLQAAFD
jgi:manganese-dependent inorganic pyrophosphatase